MSSVVPEGWEDLTLGDIYSKFSSGMTPSRAHPEYFDGDILWVTSGELDYKRITDTKEKITPEAVDATNLRIYPENTFFMAITGLEAAGTRGRCAVLGKEATVNQSCMAFEPIERVDTQYLFQYYRMHGEKFAFRYSQGTKQQSYNAAIAKILPILLPPLPEQKKIASILTSVDKVIEKTESQIAKLQDLKTGMMQELLAKGIGHTEFKDSPVGRIPVGWEVAKLKEVTTKFQNGYAFSASGYADEGIPIISMALIGLDGKFNTNYAKTKYWDCSARQELQRYIVNYGDLLIAMTDVTPTMELIGRCCLAECESESFLNQRVGLLRLKENRLSRSFFAYYSNNEYWRSYSKGVSGLGAQANIGTSQILDGLVVLPSLEEQNSISSAISSVDSDTVQKKLMVGKLNDLKASLMQDLLTGKFRVKTD